MKIFKKRYLPFFALGLMAIILGGCLVSEETITPNTAQPTFSANSKVETTLPTVTNVTAYPGEPTATFNTYRIYVTFSEDMDPTTINTSTISLRDLTAAPVAITGYTVAYDTTNATLKRAIIEYTNTTTAGPTYAITDLEVIVSTEVKDLAGNGIAGLSGAFDAGLWPIDVNTTSDADTENEYRIKLGSGAAVDYEPTRIAGMTMGGTSVLVTFTVTFSTANVDAATIADTDFALSPDIKSTCTYDESDLNTAGVGFQRIRFTNCTATANTEYTLTFTPPATLGTTDQYPDGATAVSKTQIFDAKDNAAGLSDYVWSFITLFNDDITADGKLPSAGEAGMFSKTVTVTFTKAMDQTNVVDVSNYTVLDTNVPANDLQFDIIPVFSLNTAETGTEIKSIKISTANYSGTAIGDIHYSTNLISDSSVLLTGEVFDQDGDNKAELLNDYDRDGQPDEW